MLVIFLKCERTLCPMLHARIRQRVRAGSLAYVLIDMLPRVWPYYFARTRCRIRASPEVLDWAAVGTVDAARTFGERNWYG